MDGYLSCPQSGKGPMLLILPAWWGLNSFFKTLCDRFATEGYVVFTPDYYQEQTAGTIEEAKKLKAKLNQKEFFADLQKKVDDLLLHEAVTSSTMGVIGFSLGARMALELSVVKPEIVTAVAVFYGTSLVDYSTSQAAYQGHFAETDEWTSLSGIKKLEKTLTANHRPVDFYVYPETGHWFFESDRPEAYHADAALLAWERLLDFVKKNLPV